MNALILSCGGSPEPLIFCINNFKPDFTYFLCSNDSIDIANDIAIECSLKDNQFNVKVVKNHESLEDCFAKSREIIKELEKDYDNIHVDFTGGTKPMVSGLVLAAIGEDCTYSYVGSKDSAARDKNGLGVVQNGFELIKDQRDPYDVFAVMEFNKGMDFFNKYQFEAARVNFKQASEKLESQDLKELSELYIELVDVYDKWDKFNNVKGKKLTLDYLLSQILDKINNSDNLKNHLDKNYPNFTFQMENNIEFLKLKISSKGKLKQKNVKYYLPDLLNNAYRRIEEGKYDDAIARLYRSIELIAQYSLTNEHVVNEDNLQKNKEFSINVIDVDALYDANVNDVLSNFMDYQKAKLKGRKTFRIGLKNSYQLLESMGSEYAKDYLNDVEIEKNLRLRNRSILAHGLQPIDGQVANRLYSQVLSYAKRAFPDIVKYMNMADFPKFE